MARIVDKDTPPTLRSGAGVFRADQGDGAPKAGGRSCCRAGQDRRRLQARWRTWYKRGGFDLATMHAVAAAPGGDAGFDNGRARRRPVVVLEHHRVVEPMRWFSAPQRTAYLSRARQPGSVLRVS